MRAIFAVVIVVSILHLLAGCQLVQRIDKLCFQHEDGKSWCQCRDIQTDEFVECK